MNKQTRCSVKRTGFDNNKCQMTLICTNAIIAKLQHVHIISLLRPKSQPCITRRTLAEHARLSQNLT